MILVLFSVLILILFLHIRYVLIPTLIQVFSQAPFLGRCTTMHSILLVTHDQVNPNNMITEFITPEALISESMNPILLGRCSCLNFCMHKNQWNWFYSTCSYKMDWVFLQMNELFLWPIQTVSIKILLILLSTTGNCIKGRLNQITSIKFFNWSKKILIQLIQVTTQLRLFHLIMMPMMFKKYTMIMKIIF